MDPPHYQEYLGKRRRTLSDSRESDNFKQASFNKDNNASSSTSCIYSKLKDGSLVPMEWEKPSVHVCDTDFMEMASVQLWKCNLKDNQVNLLTNCTDWIKCKRIATPKQDNPSLFVFEEMDFSQIQIPVHEERNMFILKYFLFRGNSIAQTSYSAPFYLANPEEIQQGSITDRQYLKAVRKNLKSQIQL